VLGFAHLEAIPSVVIFLLPGVEVPSGAEVLKNYAGLEAVLIVGSLGQCHALLPGSVCFLRKQSCQQGILDLEQDCRAEVSTYIRTTTYRESSVGNFSIFTSRQI